MEKLLSVGEFPTYQQATQSSYLPGRKLAIRKLRSPYTSDAG